MRRCTFVAVAILIWMAAPMEAQDGVRPGLATGFTVENGNRLGLAASLHVEVPVAAPLLDVRLEGMFQQARFRDLFFMGSAKLWPLASRPAFYGIAGVGTYLDNGANFTWSAGAGVDLGTLSSAPLFLEFRSFFARDQFSTIWLGVNF